MRVVTDLEALSRAAAEEFTRRARAATTRQGHFRVALAGGSTPARLYALLADPRRSWRRRIPWAKVHVFFGDERAVPLTHRDSNYRMARFALLRRVPIPPSQIHPIRVAGHRRSPGLKAAHRAAHLYDRVLRRAFATPDRGIPRFDLVLLGMGADGHVASIFPGSGALRIRRRLVTGVSPPGSAGPGGTRARVTLTLPVINAASCVMILVSGESKSDTLVGVLASRRGRRGAGAAGRGVLPASLVKPTRGDLFWIVDRAAAERLPQG